MYNFQFVDLLLVTTFGSAAFALWKGDTPARLAGAFVAADQIIAWVLHYAIGYSAQDVIQLILDGAWAVGLLLLALRYASLWLGMTMMLQSVQFSLHAYYLVAELPARDVTHQMINNIDNTGICACIVFGTVLAIRRRAKRRREDQQRAQETAPPVGDV